MKSVAQELATRPHTGKASEEVVRMTGGQRNSPKVQPKVGGLSEPLEVAAVAAARREGAQKKPGPKDDMSRFGPGE